MGLRAHTHTPTHMPLSVFYLPFPPVLSHPASLIYTASLFLIWHKDKSHPGLWGSNCKSDRRRYTGQRTIRRKDRWEEEG